MDFTEKELGEVRKTDSKRKDTVVIITIVFLAINQMLGQFVNFQVQQQLRQSNLERDQMVLEILEVQQQILECFEDAFEIIYSRLDCCKGEAARTD